MERKARALLSWVSTLIAFLLCSQICKAQADPWERVKIAEQGRNVQIKLRAGKSVTGRMDAWRMDGLSVRKGNKIVSFEKSEISQVALIIGRTRGRKALLAGLIAGGITAGLATAAYNADGYDLPAASVPLFAGIWGGAAAGIAALFPPHLEVIYPESPGRPATKKPK